MLIATAGCHPAAGDHRAGDSEPSTDSTTILAGQDGAGDTGDGLDPGDSGDAQPPGDLSGNSGDGLDPGDSGDAQPPGDPTGGSGDAPQPCCGCLCADPAWSCSADTCVDDDGAAILLGPEAGFFELPSRDVTHFALSYTTNRERMWYSFRPANVEPRDAPLLVFFNGGPGSATMFLWAGNTSNVAVSLDSPNLGEVITNPRPWAELGNLLYVDPHNTGFSYSMPLVDGDPPPTLTFDTFFDATAVVSVVLRFLVRHPQLLDNPVIFVGESWGGKRIANIFKLLFQYTSLRDSAEHHDEALADDIDAFLTARFGALGDAAVDNLFAKLGPAVMIQPSLVGVGSDPVSPACVPDPCSYDCREPEGYLASVGDIFTAAITDPVRVEELLGVEITTIGWLQPAARGGAGDRTQDAVDQTALVALLGPLEPQDVYYAPSFTGFERLDGPAFLTNAMDELSLVLPMIDLFVTHAVYDGVVNSAPQLLAFPSYSDTIVAATSLPDEPIGAPRPGVVQLELDDGTLVPVRMPTYEAGHVVTLDASPELLDDVIVWWAGLPL